MKNPSSILLVVLLAFFALACHKSNLQRDTAKQNSSSAGKASSNPGDTVAVNPPSSCYKPPTGCPGH